MHYPSCMEFALAELEAGRMCVLLPEIDPEDGETCVRHVSFNIRSHDPVEDEDDQVRACWHVGVMASLRETYSDTDPPLTY